MDNDLFEKLYKKYYRELYLYALSLSKNQHKAQDLVNDTFFKALISLDQEDAYFKYWLFRVCKNLFLDNIRKDKEVVNIDSLFLSIKQTPLDNIIDSEKRKAIFNEVIKLPQQYREVVILYYYNSFSIREISKHIGSTESSVKVNLYRARKKLKIRLGDELWTLNNY